MIARKNTIQFILTVPFLYTVYSQQLSLESVQALSRDIRMQTLSLQAEREQLATAQRGSVKSGQQPATTQQQQQQATNQAKNKNRDTSHKRPADTAVCDYWIFIVIW